MAITIDFEPTSGYVPVYNDIVFRVDSSLKTEDNFRYFAKIYIKGVFAFKMRVHPNADGGLGEFRVNRMLEEYVKSDHYTNVRGFAPASNSWTYFTIGFGEEYTDYTAGGVAFQTTTLDDSLVYPGAATFVWNGAFQYDDEKHLRGEDYTDYYITRGEVAKFLTNRSKTMFCDIGSEDYLYFLFDYTSSPPLNMALKVVTTYKDGTTMEYQRYNTYYDDLMMAISSGPWNLNYELFWDIMPPSLAAQHMVVNSDVVSYTVVIIDRDTDIELTETRTYMVKHNAYRPAFTPVRLAWLNRLGGYDAMTFSGRNMDDLKNITRTSYSKLIPKPYTLGTPDTFGGDVVVDINADRIYALSSDYMTPQEAKAMEELFTSPDVRFVTINIPMCVTKNNTGDFLFNNSAEGRNITNAAEIFYDVEGLSPAGIYTVTGDWVYPGTLVTNFPVDDVLGLVWEWTTYVVYWKPGILLNTEYLKRDGRSDRPYRFELEVRQGFEIKTQRGVRS